MFTISCYSFHPIVKRYLTIWRYAQIVSECLTFLLSCLCCQCGALMPLSNASSAEEKPSIEAFKIMSEPIIQAGRAAGEPFPSQHLVIDFTPQPGDTEAAGDRCQQFWQALHSRPDLNELMASPEDDTELMNELADVPSVHRPSSPRQERVLPALHIIRNLDERGTVEAAFATSSKQKS